MSVCIVIPRSQDLSHPTSVRGIRVIRYIKTRVLFRVYRVIKVNLYHDRRGILVQRAFD